MFIGLVQPLRVTRSCKPNVAASASRQQLFGAPVRLQRVRNSPAPARTFAAPAMASGNPNGSPVPPPAFPKFEYPVTRRDQSVVEDYHGTKIADPYRWLEDPDSAETKEWVDAQNKVSFEFLEKYCTSRVNLKKKFEAMYNYDKFSCPFRRGKRIFFSKMTGLQNQPVLYVQDSLEAEPRVLLDPNTLSEDGTASLGTYSVSESGEYIAYGVARSGSDWNTVYVREVGSGKDLPDCLEWVKFSGLSWTHDDAGFYYGRAGLGGIERAPRPCQGSKTLSQYPAPKKLEGTGHDSDKKGEETDANFGQMLYFHRVGKKQAEDKLILEVGAGAHGMTGGWAGPVDESTAPVNRLYIADISDRPADGTLELVKVVDNFDAGYDYLTNKGTRFYFRTNKDAPRYKIICIDLARPQEEHWEVIVPQSDDVLEGASVAHSDKLVLTYLHDVKELIRVHDLTGAFVREVPLPTLGAIAQLSARPEDSDIFYKFTSFMHPGTIYRYDLAKPDEGYSVFRDQTIAGYSSDNFQTQQVFFESRDGTRVPMFIVSKKGFTPSGDAPCLLYGYGGFSISLSPFFSIFRILWCQLFNGIYCVPNLRGGAEYGEDWHKQGILGKKQNVFDDFQAAAEYLVSRRYTKPGKIVINGGSNGGLLVAACINQRPDLFRAAVAQSDEFDFLIKYSPVHNVRGAKQGPGEAPAPSEYPCTLLTTGDHDDRVVPLHSYKLIAQLQAPLGDKEFQKNPLLIRIETKAGHGAGKPTAKVIEEAADVYAFAAYCLGLPPVPADA
eukprot:tig00000248_g21786.t1